MMMTQTLDPTYTMNLIFRLYIVAHGPKLFSGLRL
jgi:hypothetical protein